MTSARRVQLLLSANARARARPRARTVSNFRWRLHFLDRRKRRFCHPQLLARQQNCQLIIIKSFIASADLKNETKLTVCCSVRRKIYLRVDVLKAARFIPCRRFLSLFASNGKNKIFYRLK